MPGRPPLTVVLERSGHPDERIPVKPSLRGVFWDPASYPYLPHSQRVDVPGGVTLVRLEYDYAGGEWMSFDPTTCPDPLHGVVWGDFSTLIAAHDGFADPKEPKYLSSLKQSSKPVNDGCFPVDNTIWCPSGSRLAVPLRVVLERVDDTVQTVCVAPSLRGVFWDATFRDLRGHQYRHVPGAVARVRLEYDEYDGRQSIVFRVAECPDPVHGVVWGNTAAVIARSHDMMMLPPDDPRYLPYITITGLVAADGCIPVDNTIWCPCKTAREHAYH